MNERKGKYHVMMCFLVAMWGIEFAVAKDALNSVDTFVILNFKFFLAIFFIGAVCYKTGNLSLPKLHDLPIIIGTTILGHIIYFYSEYTALECDVPVANISVMFGFLPVGTVIIEKLVFKRKVSLQLVALMFCCIIGISLTIGIDVTSLAEGKAKGYAFCCVALLAWLSYLFTTESITNKYGALKIALYQVIIAWIITLPVMVPNISEIPQLGYKVLLEMIYLGLVSEGLCFIIEITGLEKLGSTISAVYSNFLPVTSAFFGFVLLGQELVPLQYVGGIIVIVSGFFIIREKDRLDRLTYS